MEKIAIVTGASRGIGAAITKKLSFEGYRVVGVYEKNTKKANEMSENNKNIEMIKADIGNEKKIKYVVDWVIKKYKKLDVLVNNAGIAIGGNVEKFNLTDWNRMISVNLTAKYLFIKFAIPYLRKSKGVVVNISSRGGLSEFVFPGFVGYSVTNAGINNMTLGLAKELREDGIRVNAVIPTVTDTDRFKNAFTTTEQEEIRNSGKLGTAEEVSDHVWKLISDKFLSGEIIIDKKVYIKTTA